MKHLVCSYFQKWFVTSLCFFVIMGKALAKQSLPRHAVQLTGGYSAHGSGDMKGIVAGAEYIRYASKKLFLNYNIRSTINSQKHEFIVNNQAAGSSKDESIRFTTAGVQLGLDGGYSFIRSKPISMSVSLGTFLRYQSASNGTDGYSLYSPTATGIPTFLIGYDNQTPQETIAIGGLIQLQLDISVTKKFYVGLLPRFQTDSNGDAIVQYALSVGRRF